MRIDHKQYRVVNNPIPLYTYSNHARPFVMPRKKPTLPEAESTIGQHPEGESFGAYTTYDDGHTDSKVPHRALTLPEECVEQTVAQLRGALINHHADEGKIARIKSQLERLGFDHSKLQTGPIPRADKTRKGNLAEIFLAEYVSTTAEADLPVFRLRYNPNTEQSMKGDDVLVFDFNQEPVRVFVGEAKYRGASSKEAVKDMVKALFSSHRIGVPASLQFVADRLFETGQSELGQRVEDCAASIANGNHDLRYVGLLMSTGRCKKHVDEHTEASAPNLVVLSFTADNLTEFYQSCYEHIEEEAFGTPN